MKVGSHAYHSSHKKKTYRYMHGFHVMKESFLNLIFLFVTSNLNFLVKYFFTCRGVEVKLYFKQPIMISKQDAHDSKSYLLVKEN